MEEMVFESITCIHGSILKKRKLYFIKFEIFSPRRKI